MLALGLTAVLVAGGLAIRNIAGGFDEAVSARAKLEQAHGAPGAFTPWPDGSIPADRLEVFLRVRDAMAPDRHALSGRFGKLPLTESQQAELKQAHGFDKFVKTLFIGKDALTLVPELGRYMGRRDAALLDAGMGMGEYTYLYCLIFHVWLGHPPADGPGRAGNAGDGGRRGGGMTIGSPEVLWRIHDDLLAMLRHQQDALPAGADPAWRQALAGEIAAMEKSDDRLAWQDGLPAAASASLEPYRDRLEASYDPITNAFELSRTSKRGRYSYEAE